MRQIVSIIRISMITNFFLALFKFIFGIMGKSSALIADGIHSFSDLSTDVVAFFGSKVASKPADEKHPFGHGKAEYLTSLIIGVVVFLLGGSLVIDNLKGDIVTPSSYVMFVSLFTIIAKYVLSSYLIYNGKKYDNKILLSSGKESSADVISSLFVLISSIFMQLSSYFSIFKYADMVASIIVGLFIIHTGISLIRENVSSIIGEQETNEDVLNEIKNTILSDNRIVSIDRLNILKLGHICNITCELTMSGELSLLKCHQIIDDAEARIKLIDKKYEYITIHVNPK